MQLEEIITIVWNVARDVEIYTHIMRYKVTILINKIIIVSYKATIVNNLFHTKEKTSFSQVKIAEKLRQRIFKKLTHLRVQCRPQDRN